jgi:hypothetical protein
MINRETAKQFLEVNGYPNPDSNFENELLDTMVEYAQQQVKNNDSLHSVSGCFTADDVERAYDDGYQTEGEITFDINNYR